MNFTKFIKDAEETFGERSVMLLSDDTSIDVETIPTGISMIDEATGVGGIPRGRITEIFGGEGSGKTSICLHVIAEAQKLGLSAGYVDAEHALDRKRMEKIGVQFDKTIISQPDDGEQALDIVEMMIRSKKFAVVIVDSVAALTPKIEMEKDMGEATMGSQARLMSQAMRKLVATIGATKTAVIFINQTRAKLGTFYPEETTTGGNALKFYASLRMKLQYVGQLTNKDKRKIGGKYRLTVVKNKLAVPFRETLYTVGDMGIQSIAVKKEEHEE